MAKAQLLNFRCPEQLWEDIETVGKNRHPVPESERHHRSSRTYDLTATMLDIVRAGISALNGDHPLLDKTDYKTTDKTDIEAMIRAAIAPIEEEMEALKKS